MDDDFLDLVNRLFATATGMIEDAIEVAVAGQSPRLNPARLAGTSQRLQAAARDIAIVVEAATIAAKLDISQRQNRRKRPR